MDILFSREGLFKKALGEANIASGPNIIQNAIC